MPVPDAGVRLPRLVLDVFLNAALAIQNHRAALVGVQVLGGDHRLQFAVALEIGVVEIGGDAQANVGGRINGQDHVVKIQHVGIVFVNEVNDPVEIFFDKGLGQRRILALRPTVIANLVILRVKVLRIEAFPPLPLAVGLGQQAVVRHAGQRAARIGTLRGLIPAPGAVAVARQRQPQTSGANRLGPAAHHVLFRPDGDAVPRLIRRVEIVEVVVMVGQGREIFCARAFVEANQMFGIPGLGLPFVDHILETHFGRMPVMRALIFIVGITKLIHFLRIPVAHSRLALRTPVRPDAELRVAEPVGHLVAGQRFPRRLKRPGGDAKSGRRNNRRRRGRQRRGRRGGGRDGICGGKRSQRRQRRGGAGEQRGFLDELTA